MTSESGVDNQLVYDPLGGMGLLRGVVIDAHFTRKGREGRLWKLLQDTRYLDVGAARGFGVDENTAFVCRRTGIRLGRDSRWLEPFPHFPDLVALEPGRGALSLATEVSGEWMSARGQIVVE